MEIKAKREIFSPRFIGRKVSLSVEIQCLSWQMYLSNLKRKFVLPLRI